MGFAGYGLGQSLELGASGYAESDEPECAAGFYDHAFIWDRFSKRVFVAGVLFAEPGVGDVPPHIAHGAAWCALSDGLPDALPVLPDVPAVRFRADQPRAAYCQAIEQARAYIAAGDIFQVNITGRYTADFPQSFANTALYRALRQQSPAPFGAYLSCGAGYALHSSSPERFLQCDAQGVVTSRPIKVRLHVGRPRKRMTPLRRASAWMRKNGLKT